jgi:hypothetical protein
MELERLQVVAAPNLEVLQVTKCSVLATEPTSMRLRSPKLKHLHWEDQCPDAICPYPLPKQDHISKLAVIELSLHYLIVCDDTPVPFHKDPADFHAC